MKMPLNIAVHSRRLRGSIIRLRSKKFRLMNQEFGRFSFCQSTSTSILSTIVLLRWVCAWSSFWKDSHPIITQAKEALHQTSTCWQPTPLVLIQRRIASLKCPKNSLDSSCRERIPTMLTSNKTPPKKKLSPNENSIVEAAWTKIMRARKKGKRKMKWRYQNSNKRMRQETWEDKKGSGTLKKTLTMIINKKVRKIMKQNSKVRK